MIELKILGANCPKCEELLKQTEQAVADLGLECTLEKITDMQQIISYGVMRMPALVVNGEVKITGQVPSLDDLKGMLS